MQKVPEQHTRKAGHTGTTENSIQTAESTNVEVENVHNHTVTPS